MTADGEAAAGAGSSGGGSAGADATGLARCLRSFICSTTFAALLCSSGFGGAGNSSATVATPSLNDVAQPCRITMSFNVMSSTPIFGVSVTALSCAHTRSIDTPRPAKCATAAARRAASVVSSPAAVRMARCRICSTNTRGMTLKTALRSAIAHAVLAVVFTMSSEYRLPKRLVIFRRTSTVTATLFSRS